MLDTSKFFKLLTSEGISFFTGVPDSSLKDMCAYITQNTSSKNHIIAASEGNAVALAAGHYLSSGSPGLVYMQNSGLGNAVNPLTSLTDKEVYQIPMLLVIGWRGKPGVKDEPQHVKKGKITLELLELLGIPYEVLSKDFEQAKTQTKNMLQKMKANNSPCALVVEKNSFDKFRLDKEKETFTLTREEAIKTVLEGLKGDEIVISTTGKISRELYELREKRSEGHEKDFLTVGSMGHLSSIALGIALNKHNKTVVAVDGDGSLIMHLGSLAINGSQDVNNFKHIVLNNGAHDSVGGQPTVGFKVSLTEVAKSCNYKNVWSVETQDELKQIIPKFLQSEGINFLEIKIRLGSREDLGRPKEAPVENKKKFMSYLLE